MAGFAVVTTVIVTGLALPRLVLTVFIMAFFAMFLMAMPGIAGDVVVGILFVRRPGAATRRPEGQEAK